MNYTYKTWFKYVIIYGNNQIGCLIVSKISDDCKRVFVGYHYRMIFHLRKCTLKPIADAN